MEKINNIPQGKIRKNIRDAPYAIGDCVKVVYSADDTFDHKYIGHVGKVSYYNYSCGCGQTYPNDPMIGVEFNSRDSEEFWKEEVIAL